MKPFVYLLLAFIVSITLLGCNRYVQFEPLILKEGANNQLVADHNILESQEFVENVKVILAFYQEDYRTNSKGIILTDILAIKTGYFIGTCRAISRSMPAFRCGGPLKCRE